MRPRAPDTPNMLPYPGILAPAFWVLQIDVVYLTTKKQSKEKESHQAAPTTESPIASPMPVNAHTYGEVSVRNLHRRRKRHYMEREVLEFQMIDLSD